MAESVEVRPGSRCVRATALLTAAGLGLLLAACGAGALPTAGPAEASSPPASDAPAGHPVDFTATTTTGAEFDGADLVGRDVVLWFWAPWCTVCRTEAPQVAAAAEQMAGRVEVVGVASSGPLADMQAFVAETGTDSFTHVADVSGEVWQRFGIVAQPTFVFVDDDGRTQAVVGGIAQAALVDAMRQLEEA
jgi:thiol-disulfide isomerase/thioredoxin